MSTTSIDPNRLAFLQGVLAALASNGQTIHYNEIRRLCRLNQEQLGTYLGEARRRMLEAGQPDFCSVVVRDAGWPGDGWAAGPSGTDPREWAKALRLAHTYWRDRRRMDNPEFESAHGALPEVPGR
ncbi:MAG: hypothetical protein Rubg2KO_40930 [Rubricoccaceae bacterium]